MKLTYEDKIKICKLLKQDVLSYGIKIGLYITMINKES